MMSRLKAASVAVLLLVWLHGASAEATFLTCISNCENKTDGNYVICGDKCEQGYFLACHNGNGNEMPCALGMYHFKNGTQYNARLIFDPSMDACTYSKEICSTPSFQVRTCVAYGCSYRKDGLYALCGEQCLEGYYAECERGILKKVQCERNESNPQEKLVFQPSSKQCEPSSETCTSNDEIAENLVKNKPSSCVNDDNDCSGLPDGNYKICKAESCLAGLFASCSGELYYERECSLGLDYSDPNKQVTKRLIYHPETDSCEYSADICHEKNEVADNSDNTTAKSNKPDCVDSCKNMPDGNYMLCGEQCNGYYATCSNDALHKMECALGYHTHPDGATNLTRTNYEPSQDKCLFTTNYCDGFIREALLSHVNGANRFVTPWILICLLIKTTSLLHTFA
ncbi:chitin-binding domain protein cbd-1-like [Physella acuta]|uniref:chitin-binding domain protein cbd-1-like n=1 Tax=Physella acuta TaxID=109671 RepID=UPI0027DBAB91|nr:chitin-binding domain protein cbd-1-like [Physella acuta]